MLARPDLYGTGRLEPLGLTLHTQVTSLNKHECYSCLEVNFATAHEEEVGLEITNGAAHDYGQLYRRANGRHCITIVDRGEGGGAQRRAAPVANVGPATLCHDLKSKVAL
jgi:hypothetical protein